MIPKYYEFSINVKIISGEKALENLPFELNRRSSKRPIIITDKGIVEAGLNRLVIDAFAETETTIGAVYEDTPIDSSNIVVNEVAGIYREKGCDSIVAVGGGSVIDTAKGVNVVVSEDTDDLLKYMGNDRLSKPMNPLVVIPTTAGTGSEVTSAAVIRNEEKGIKMQLVSPLLLPDLAILDPRMTQTMPPRITAATAMDALTHAIEAFIGPQKNPVSDAFASSAIELIREHVFVVIENKKDEDARLAMANAALLAGVAFSNSMVGVIHAIAHALGGVCHVPHGLANAIILPYGMEYSMDRVRESITGLLLPLVGEAQFVKVPAQQRAEQSIVAVRALSSRIKETTGIPLCLKDAGVPEERLEEIAQTAINDAAIAFSHKLVSFEDALNILKAAY